MLFTRDLGSLRVDGVRAADLHSLIERLVAAHPGAAVVASDLSLGGWRPLHAASEIAEQLRLSRPVLPGAPFVTRDGAWRTGEVVNRLIDAETAGDGSVVALLDMASRVRARADAGGVPLTVCVIAPRFGLRWEPGDAMFVRLLIDALRGWAHHVGLAGCDASVPALPADWRVCWRGDDPPVGASPATPATLVGLVPGVLDPAVG